MKQTEDNKILINRAEYGGGEVETISMPNIIGLGIQDDPKGFFFDGKIYSDKMEELNWEGVQGIDEELKIGGVFPDEMVFQNVKYSKTGRGNTENTIAYYERVRS
jgi:hypothetical protein